MGRLAGWLALVVVPVFLAQDALAQATNQRMARPLFSHSLPKLFEPADPSARGSPYVPMDSWVYPAMDRLSSLGYIDDAFFGLRPWTRLSILHVIEGAEPTVMADGGDEAVGILAALKREFAGDLSANAAHTQLDRVYARVLGMAGAPPLVNSFEFGQTVINDDGRPYGHGFNAITGAQAHAMAGRFSLNVRGEYQHAPGYPALPLAVQQTIAAEPADVLTPADANGVGNRDNFRLLDANLSFHFLRHEISVGKSEMWWGPDKGGAYLWSTNAEPVYSFRVNLIDPVRIPLVWRILGPIRYDNYFASLKGHVSPNRPFIFGNKISIHPLPNLELGFSRSCEFAGKDESPLTAHTFLKCFFSAGDQLNAFQKPFDVGDRRSNFDFRWRVPYLQKAVTIYADSVADDDPSPIANFRRSGWSPGIYISHLPGLKKMDFRFEAPYTNASHTNGVNPGEGTVYENLNYKDGFTNKGLLIGHWIGRDSTGYQSWLTYWFNPKEQLQLEYRDAKIDRGFWVSGGTQTDVSGQLVKRFWRDVEVTARVQWERYTIPVLTPGVRQNVSASFQMTWFPERH